VIRSGSSGAGKSTSRRQTVKLGFVNAKALCVNATGSCPVTVGRDLAVRQYLVGAETFHPCAARAGEQLSWNQGKRMAHMN
jgi:hypothetical protein